jgi:hypothetical protein
MKHAVPLALMDSTIAKTIEGYEFCDLETGDVCQESTTPC